MGEVRAFSPHVRWTDAEVRILHNYYATASWGELASLLPGRGNRVIQCKANALGLERQKPPKRTADEVLAAKRESMARRRAADPEAVRAYQRDFHAANRDAQTAKMRDYYARRFFWGRAMKLRSEGRATFREIARLWKAQRGRCALTGRRLDRDAQLDHILPRARGGGDEITNLRWVCNAANLAKRDMTDAEFETLCADVMRWIGERIAMVEALSQAEAA